MTYLKSIIATILLSTIGLLYLQTTIQRKEIQQLHATVDSLRIEVELQSVGAKAEGEIDALLRQYEKDNNETNDTYDATDGNYTVDFDSLF